MLAPLLFAAIQVLSPADGATLRGGHFATLSWSAQQLPRGAEEWEAFLSVDGGKYYAVRLTPHLDISIRRFEVLIPNVDSDDARLLVRTGDERHETILELPQHLRIRAEAQEAFVTRTGGGGSESARPNDPLVVQWSVGDHVETSATPASLSASKSVQAHAIEIALTTMRVQRESGGQAILPVRTDRIVCPPRRSADVLLRVSRLNV